MPFHLWSSPVSEICTNYPKGPAGRVRTCLSGLSFIGALLAGGFAFLSLSPPLHVGKTLRALLGRFSRPLLAFLDAALDVVPRFLRKPFTRMHWNGHSLGQVLGEFFDGYIEVNQKSFLGRTVIFLCFSKIGLARAAISCWPNARPFDDTFRFERGGDLFSDELREVRRVGD